MKIHAQQHSETVLRDSGHKWLATLTHGAYTVRLAGPSRTFAESTAADSVTHSVWVRSLPHPFDGHVDRTWLKRALKANQKAVPDVLAIAMQYIAGRPAIFDRDLQVAGDAFYGPLKKNNKREEGADFNDYLGIEWVYSGKTRKPRQRLRYCLDCSGFIRMVWGYRHHLPGYGYADTVPFSFAPRQSHSTIPRRSFQIYAAAPGVLVVPNAGAQVKDFSSVRIGDLLFFDADADDGTRIDHVGMYLGPDGGHHHRFISSRQKVNGPTLGDVGGKSILDGTSTYPKAFRAVRRL